MRRSRQDRVAKTVRAFVSTPDPLARADLIGSLIDRSTCPMMVHADDGEVLRLSRAWVEQTGYAPEEIPTIAAWAEKAHGAGEDFVREHISGVYETAERSAGGRYRIRAKNGAVRVWEFSTVPLGRLPDGRRVVLTQAFSLAAADPHETTRRRWARIFDCIDWGIVVADASRQTFQLVNRAFAEMHGYAPEELIGRRVETILAPSARSDLDDLIRRIHESGHLEFELLHLRKDGSEFPALVRATHLRGVDGEPDARVVSAIDITERRAAEEERRRMADRMREAQKLESLGVLAGGIAHDFSNLLTGVLGNATLALTKVGAASEISGQLRSIESAARAMADLAHQMLAYSGKGRFHVQAVDLSLLVEEMAHLLQSAISKKAVLRFDFSPAPVVVEADLTQLRQVAMNLILNASEALEDRSGSIRVTTGLLRPTAADRTRWALDRKPVPAGPYAFLEVADEGCGMDEATQARIFDPFFTTKFSGRGLGLAAVLGIVRGHGGGIDIRSAPDAGTTIRVCLPASNERRRESQPVAAPPRPIAAEDPIGVEARRGTILVIDDEAVVRDGARAMLEAAGFDVRTAVDGVEGIELFASEVDRILAVILDLTMPRMDGIEALGRFRAIAASTPVILASGYHESDVAERLIGAPPAGFIQKPFTPSELIAKIEACLAGSEESAP